MNLFVDLIETFFKITMVIRSNGISRTGILTWPQKTNPAAYKNLIVRVGGFSAYFVELDPLLQDEIIARTEQIFARSSARRC